MDANDCKAAECLDLGAGAFSPATTWATMKTGLKPIGIKVCKRAESFGICLRTEQSNARTSGTCLNRFNLRRHLMLLKSVNLNVEENASSAWTVCQRSAPLTNITISVLTVTKLFSGDKDWVKMVISDNDM